MSPALLMEVLERAAADARRPFRVVERRGAGPDHPVRLGFPESEYLKCVVLEVLE
jgi:23S rRNA (cytosine1962-C5)-methyltransferase